MRSKRRKFSKNSEHRAFIGALLCGFAISSFSPAFAASRQSATVDQVLTGDRVRLKGGSELRYAGIETYSPESNIPLSRTYGIQAQEFNHALVGGKKIAIEWGPRLRDKQNRLLGYVFTEDGTFVNAELVKQGHAKVRIVVPNTLYVDELKKWEKEARIARKGVWEKEPYDPKAATKLIGEKNTKIYYLPTSPELEKIPEAQLVTFDSRVDAKAAGYRPCFTCHMKGELEGEL